MYTIFTTHFFLMHLKVSTQVPTKIVFITSILGKDDLPLSLEILTDLKIEFPKMFNTVER